MLIVYNIDNIYVMTYYTNILTYSAIPKGVFMYKILMGGCKSLHPSSFSMSRPTGLPNYIVLIIRTAGEFWIAGSHYIVGPGHAVIIAPKTPYSYHNPSGNYSDDWLHFDVDKSIDFSTIYPICNELYPIEQIENYAFFIRQILWEASYSLSPYKDININALFTLLLNHLKMDFPNKDTSIGVSPYQTQLQGLRLNMQHSLLHNHSIKEHAKALGLSESYFQHLYTAYFGISFQKDLIQLRIEHAKYLLTVSDSTMVEIAQQCGYKNEVHFYRQFKKNCGVTPMEYKKAPSPM